MAYSQEIHGAKAACMVGTHINAGAHNPYDMNKYRNDLKKYGLHEFAYEEMRSGTSGNYLEALVSSGPIYFQALRHHVKDKIQARGTGQVNPQTRQPLRGRTNHGGLRLTGASVVDKTTASQRCSWRHDQIQGKSRLIKYLMIWKN
jgi:DNA-directed RNA polymerase beta subunit